MKKNIFTIITLFFVLFATTLSFACEKCNDCKTCPIKQETSTTSFESLKKLAGTWEGTTKMNDKDMPVKATYEVTSGGTTIIEKIFVGTPHEMISVYYPEGKTVKMTHYCMIGNRPVMTLKSSEAQKISFEMKGHEGIHSKKEMHMHALDIVWNNENQMTQNWISFKDNKQSEAVSFVWNRVHESKPSK